jgi:hypothetical protein
MTELQTLCLKPRLAPSARPSKATISLLAWFLKQSWLVYILVLPAIRLAAAFAVMVRTPGSHRGCPVPREDITARRGPPESQEVVSSHVMSLLYLSIYKLLVCCKLVYSTTMQRKGAVCP